MLEITGKIAQIILPLIAVILTGFFYAKKINPDMSGINKMNIDIFCPALIFSVMSDKAFNLGDYQFIALSAVTIILGSGLLALPVCWLLKISPKTLAPPMMFNNTGNMGLPLMVLAFGEQAIPVAVVLFVVENTLHFTVGAYLLDHRTNPLKVLKMPMISVTFLALGLSYAQVTVPVPIQTSAEMLGQICVPMMLFALGVRMTTINFSDWKIGLLGALLTPISGCLMVFLLYLFIDFSTENAENLKYLLLFSVLPPAILNYMIAEKYQQEPQQVASIVLLGNLSAVVIIPMMLFFVV